MCHEDFSRECKGQLKKVVSIISTGIQNIIGCVILYVFGRNTDATSFLVDRLEM